MATGSYDANGFYSYGEDDLADPGLGFSDLLNKSAEAVKAGVPVLVRDRVTREIANNDTVRQAATLAVGSEVKARDIVNGTDPRLLIVAEANPATAAALSAAAAYEIDWRTGMYRVGGIGVTRYQALRSDSLIQSSSAVLVAPRAVTNLFGGSLVGAAVGVLNQGGALPIGWENGFGAVPKEVLSFDTEMVTLKLGPQSNGSFGGPRIIPMKLPTEPSVISFDIKPGALPPLSQVPAHVSLSWFKDGNPAVISDTQSRLFWTGDSPRRVSCIMPTPQAGAKLAVSLSQGDNAPAQTPIISIGRFSGYHVSEVGSGAIGQAPYTATSLAASTAVLNVPDGEFVVVAFTATGEYIRRRVTVANGAGLNLAALNGWFRLSRLWVIPAASWLPALADTLMSGTPDWRSPAVRLAGNESSAPQVMAAMDRVQNPGTEITASSSDAATTRSVQLSRTVPGHMPFIVAPGDRVVGDREDGGQERAEIHVPDKMPFGQEVWCAFWGRVNAYPVDYSTDCSTSIMQARYTNPPGDTTTKSPELTLRVYPKPPSSFGFVPPAGHVGLALITNATTSEPPTNDNNLIIRKWTSIKLGQWTRFVVRVKFTRGTADGALTMWQDGVQVFDADAIAIGHNRPLGPQFRFGAYSNKHTIGTRDIEIRDVQYGTASLAARINDLAPL